MITTKCLVMDAVVHATLKVIGSAQVALLLLLMCVQIFVEMVS